MPFVNSSVQGASSHSLQTQHGTIGSLFLNLPLSALGLNSDDKGESFLPVQIRINLCSWADPDRRSITISHQLKLKATTTIKNEKGDTDDTKPALSLMGKRVDGIDPSRHEEEWDTFLGKSMKSPRDEAEPSAGGVRDEGLFIYPMDPSSAATTMDDVSGAAETLTGTILRAWSSRRYSFVSQVHRYDPNQIIETYKVDVPTVAVGAAAEERGGGASLRKLNKRTAKSQKSGKGRSQSGKKRRADDSSQEEEEGENEEEDGWDDD